MKNITILFALTTTAFFTAIGCGDSNDNTAGKGGASGSAGDAGSAGTPASGGTSGAAATGGSSGTPPTGGSGGVGPTGGTAGTGNDGGVGAEGGMGTAGMGDGGTSGTGPGGMCPANQPMGMGTICATRGLSCDYGDTVCRCGINAGTWICNDENPDCPAMPEPGEACMGMGTACAYGEAGTCLCQNPDGPPPTTEWVCDGGVVTCPATDPMDGSSCTMFPAGTECGDCTCGAGMGREWNCGGGGGMCPMMQPDDGDACMTPGNICMFDSPGPGGEATCICNTMSEWTCI